VVMWPDARPQIVQKLSQPGRLRIAREDKARLVLALRELDFDYQTGKLSGEDYKSLRAKYEVRAIQTLKQIESMEGKWNELREEIDRRLHEAIGAPATGFCPHCGKQREGGHRFCAHCGAPRETEADA